VLLRGWASPIRARAMNRGAFALDLPGGGHHPLLAFTCRSTEFRRVTKTSIAMLLLAIAATTAAPAAPVPRTWAATDYPPGAPPWWGAEVTRVPSPILAEGLAKTLRSEGWEPVYTLPSADGKVSVLVGEEASEGRAWFLLTGLRAQGMADGDLVATPAESRAPRGGDGPADTGMAASALTDKEIADQLHSTIATFAPEVRDSIVRTIELVGNGDTRHADVAPGAIAALREFWRQNREPILALEIARRVATSKWIAAADRPELRESAAELYFELAYGEKRDWREAWYAADLLEQTRGPRAVALAELFRAGLLVELAKNGRQLRGGFAAIRRQLRAANEVAPEDDALLARIHFLYVQTFAWEGDWPRVESLSREFRARFPEARGYRAMARILEARSLERDGRLEEAVTMLEEVLSLPVPLGEQLRVGMKAHDPHDPARVELDRFRSLIVERESRLAAPTPAPESAPAPTPTAAPMPETP